MPKYKTSSALGQSKPAPQSPELWTKIIGWLHFIAHHILYLIGGAILVTIVAFAVVTAFPGPTKILMCEKLNWCAAPVPVPPPVPTRLRIVVFDTAYPGRAYSKALTDNGETNAHFLAQQLRERKLDAIPAIIGRDQAARDSFLTPAPDLVIVHRSTFDPKDQGTGDQEIALLIAAAPKPIKFLVYSRKPGTDAAYAQRLATRGGAPGRVTAIELRKGDAWRFPSQIKLLLDAAENLLPGASPKASAQ